MNLDGFYKPHSHTSGFIGVTIAQVPHLSQRHAGLYHTVLRPQQEVTKPSNLPRNLGSVYRN